ncbi:hypothetical protein MRX96_010914 [Rhipicephalus microplus]
MNYNRNQQRPGNVINGAQAVNPQAANRNPLHYVAEAKDNTIQTLRNENDQLKRCIAEQRAQTQEMNATTSEPAPKKRALEYARERRVNARLDSLEERQDRLEQTMKANYETLSQVIKATNDRLDATKARLDTLVTPVHWHAVYHTKNTD